MRAAPDAGRTSASLANVGTTPAAGRCAFERNDFRNREFNAKLISLLRCLPRGYGVKIDDEREGETVDHNRRSFLNHFGKAAVVAPPVITAMLATSMSSRAIAASTGGGGSGPLAIGLIAVEGGLIAAAPKPPAQAAPPVVQQVPPPAAAPPAPSAPPPPPPPPEVGERG
jgi:hypothetical protein